MKKVLILLILISGFLNAQSGFPDEPTIEEYIEEQPINQNTNELMRNSNIAVSVVGQGVAPTFASSPAQSYALAKRAATADAYRLIAERIKGITVEGKDTVKNMMIKSSTINTRVSALIKNATVVETTYKDGLCEVEMEITLNHSDF